MWVAVGQWLLKLFAGPAVDAFVKGYTAKLQAGTDEKKLAGDLAARELGVQNTEILASTQLKIAEIGHPWEPEKLAMYITLIFYAKVVIWDVTLGLGSTDPLRGQVATWAQLIMTYYFAKRGAENITRIIGRKWLK